MLDKAMKAHLDSVWKKTASIEPENADANAAKNVNSLSMNTIDCIQTAAENLVAAMINIEQVEITAPYTNDEDALAEARIVIAIRDEVEAIGEKLNYLGSNAFIKAMAGRMKFDE